MIQPSLILKRTLLFLAVFCLSLFSMAQMPKPALVGYWENWGNMKLTGIHENYTVIQLAFATTKDSSLYDMQFNRPWWYSKVDFLADIDSLHQEHKVVILSLGGANDPIRLDDKEAYDGFVGSMIQIMTDYDYVFDGIDIDFERTSLEFGSNWTMDEPSIGQQFLIDAIREIKADYFLKTEKRMLLTMAPENIYLVGALSKWQMNNSNGGAMLPIIAELEDEID